MKRTCVYIFLDRNMGHGFETAYPPISAFLMRFYKSIIIGMPKAALSKRFGYIVYHRSEIDVNCPDPRSKGRSPRIEISVVFPWRFKERHLCSKAGNDLLQSCWTVAKQVMHKGVNPELKIELPTSWYTNQENLDE